MEPVITATTLSKQYGRRSALIDVDLEVPAGVVFGYLGPNGAGKTTTIRLLTGLLRPSSGHATILGYDSIQDREAAQRHLGYLPGEFVAYPDLTAEQYLEFLGHLHGGVDAAVTEALVKRLDLRLTERIGAMSHGNRQKLGIVQAFFHEPDVLVLDEPTAGLDPLVQREFLGLVREAREMGRTVFLSSHVLSEVEAVADMVGILRAGRLVEVTSVSRLKAQALLRVELTFDSDPPVARLRRLAGVREVHATGRTVHLVVEGSTADVLSTAAPFGISRITSREPDLEEIFLTYYGQE